MWTLKISRALSKSGALTAGLFVTSVAASGASAQFAAPQPGAAFTGDCSIPAAIESAPSPRDRILEAAGKESDGQKPARQFSEFSNRAQDRSALEACQMRIDGVWREQARVTFDASFQPQGWAAENPSLASLAHGNYTTPDLFVIDAAGDADKSLTIHSVWNGDPAIVFESADDVSLGAVLSDPKLSKTYVATADNGTKRTLKLSVAPFSGAVRFTLDGKEYYRPQSGASSDAPAAGGEQSDATDPFVVAFNPKNLRASRQGYDPVTQNPDAFMQNGGKLDIFERAAPANYQIDEQLTVPAGLTLIEGGEQGYVYFSSLISSESEAQKATEISFGVKAEVRQTKKNVGRGGSVGYDHAQSQIDGMKASNSVSTIDAYQRYKKYALVRDLPQSRLSKPFIDAVLDARASHDYSRLIAAFGTHYPYAVTYGAAGKLTTYVTEETLAQNSEKMRRDAVSGSYTVNQATVSGNISQAVTNRQGSSATTSLGKTTFVAVGGNGSWNEAGFAAGDAPYPILMDLRPISDLLNPVYFPNNPEIYTAMRAELREAVADYENKISEKVSDVSLISDFNPAQTWEINVLNLTCYDPGKAEPDNTVEIYGKLDFETKENPAKADIPSTVRLLRYSKRKFQAVGCNSGALYINKKIRVSGTIDQLHTVRARFNVNMTENDPISDDTLSGVSSYVWIPTGDAAVGFTTKQQSWKLPFSSGGNIVLHYTISRVK